MDLKIKDIVKNNKATFLYYRHQMMYYTVVVDGNEFCFPIPLDDVADATLNLTEKAMLLMRYIRKALEDKTFVRISTKVDS